LQNSLKKVLDSGCKFGVTRDVVQNMIIGREYPLRKFSKDDASEPLYLAISACAKIYCGMNENKSGSDEIIKESCRFVYEMYKWIGIHEIREAFKLAAVNTFEGVDIKAYGGIFSIAMLGDILTGYRQYRNKIILKFEAEEEKMKDNSESIKGKNAIARAKIKEDIELAIIAVQSDQQPIWETWHDVPANYAEVAVSENFIEVSHDFKSKIWEKSKQLSLKELSDAASDLSNFSEAKQARIKLTNAIETQQFPDNAKRIYSKLLIFEYVQSHKL